MRSQTASTTRPRRRSGSPSRRPRPLTPAAAAAAAVAAGDHHQPRRRRTVLLPDVDPAIEACRVRVDITRLNDRVVYRTVLATGRVRIRDRETSRSSSSPNETRCAGPATRSDRSRSPSASSAAPTTVEVHGQAERRLAVRTVTTPGSWVPDHAILTATGQRFIRRLARRLRALNITRIRCDGHTANVPAHRVNKRALSRRRAELVCRKMRQRSLAQSPASSRTPARTRSPATRPKPVAPPTAASPSQSCSPPARSNRAVSGLLRLVAPRRVAPSRQRAAPVGGA